MSRRNEAAVFIGEAQRRDVLRGLFTNYYNEIQKEKLVFDTNRIWSAKLPALSQLFPKARVVCCVRDVPWIMDSIERLVRKNAFELSGMFGFEPGNTVYTRINRVATSEGMVGLRARCAQRRAFSASRRRASSWSNTRRWRARRDRPCSISTRFLTSRPLSMISRMSSMRPTISTSPWARPGCTGSDDGSNGSSGRACCPPSFPAFRQRHVLEDTGGQHPSGADHSIEG